MRDLFEGLGDSDLDDDAADRYVPAIAPPLPRELFDEYWSEELVELYHVAVDHASRNGWPLLDRCSFHDFVEFCYERSSRAKPPC